MMADLYNINSHQINANDWSVTAMSKQKNHSWRFALFPIAIVFFEIVLYFSNDIFLTGIPQMIRDLHLTITEAQMTVSLWFIGAATTTLFVGVLSDYLGRRRVILFGALLYTCASASLIFIDNKFFFLFFRLVQGSMVSFLTVPGYAAIHEYFDKKRAIKILALMGSVTVAAPAIGPLLGGLILQVANWRYIFVTLFILGIVSTILLFLFVFETLALEKRHPFSFGSALSSYRRLIKTVDFIFYNSMLSLIFSGFIAWVTLSPILLLERFSFSTIQFGFIQLVVFSCYIAGSRVVHYFLTDDNHHVIIRAGLTIIFLSSLVGVLTAYVYPTHFFYFLPCIMLYSFSSALCFPILGRLAVEASEEPMGRRTGLQSAMLMLFASVGTMCAGWLYNGELLGLTRYIAFVSFIAIVILTCKKYSSLQCST